MATVLKSGMRAGVTQDQAPLPATFTFSDMASQGDAYLQTVRAEAAKIVQQAKADAAAIRKKAEADGQAAAEATIARMLEDQVGGKLESLRPALDDAVAQLAAAKGEWQQHWRTSAIQLSKAIAERIVRRELSTDPTISEAWLEAALKLAAGSSELTIRLAPDDLEHLRGHAEKLSESMNGIGEARFVADPSITSGGCRVETRHGSIDQQLEVQLERLAEELN
ncbi:MAG: FliH/SctL family protein [Planctomycetota bacterium]